jgi:hypothetical protein
MRRLLTSCAIFLLAAGAAHAETGSCYTRDSYERARAAMTPHLSAPYVDPEQAGVTEWRFFLVDCAAGDDRRVTCTLDSIPNEPQTLRDAARAYYAELEICPGAPREIHEAFAVGIRNATTPAPSP